MNSVKSEELGTWFFKITGFGYHYICGYVVVGLMEPFWSKTGDKILINGIFIVLGRNMYKTSTRK